MTDSPPTMEFFTYSYADEHGTIEPLLLARQKVYGENEYVMSDPNVAEIFGLNEEDLTGHMEFQTRLVERLDLFIPLAYCSKALIENYTNYCAGLDDREASASGMCFGIPGEFSFLARDHMLWWQSIIWGVENEHLLGGVWQFYAHTARRMVAALSPKGE